MAEILKEWLSERLQRPIGWQADEFSQLMRNGYIIANVLLSYNVINEEKFFLINKTTNKGAIANNWKYISQWLKEIDINLADSELTSAMEGNNSTLLRLFYQLFLHLDKRDRINFIKRERKKASELIEKVDTRFKVEELKEEEKTFADELSKPLLNEKHYIQWQKQKAEEVKNTFDFIRHKFKRLMLTLDEKHACPQLPKGKPEVKPPLDEKDFRQFSCKFPCSFANYTYEELLKLEEQAMERKKSFVDSEWVRNYLENLHVKLGKKADSHEFQNQVRNNLSNSMWDMSIAEEEERLDTELAEKVMKLCQFEKQICTQLMETKQQGRNLAKARMEADNEFKEQRSQQFDQFLDSIKEQMQTEIDEIDYEKKRQNELHQELYAEKMKRKRQHYYEICYETMLSVVDYATKFAYFKKLMDGEVPEYFIDEWKKLYFKMQPIFEILTPVDEILKEPSIATDEEDIKVLDEMDRQEILNDCDFKDYHNYTNSWQLSELIPNYDPDNVERVEEKLGKTVLGHVVYTLLELKYPFPAAREPAKLPIFSTKTVIRGLPDRSLAVPMQKLLKFRKIQVIRPEAAITFCLQKFKAEMVGCTDIHLTFDNFISSAAEDDDKEFLKLVKAESDQIEKSNESSLLLAGPTLPNTKITQTPKTLPEEDIVLSDPAELGRYTYEALAFGDTLTDHLLSAMIVEYIKAQENIDGFVIINYPNNYREARILEGVFTGREPPHDKELDNIDDMVYLEESILKHDHKENDSLKKFRVSRLVDNPHKRDEDKPFVSYLTSYMNLKYSPDILQEQVIWDLNNENSELIDRFYASLGLNYSIYYETVDKDVLIQICKYIIGDVYPDKSTDSLFGSNFSSLFDFPSTEDKRRKSKVTMPRLTLSNSEKLKREKSDSELKIEDHTYRDEFGQESTFEELKEEQSKTSGFKLPEFVEEGVIAKPGDEEWVYGNLHLAEVVGMALASFWEQIEKVYLHDLHQLFLAKRLQMYNLVPYTRFIKDKMEQIITLPSEKQDYVEAFQKQYNEFENDWRDYKLSKNEWHCRIKTLQDKLHDISDQRKQTAQKQRLFLISDNWAMEEMVSMVNTYISLMQTELNRYYLTMQILEDFYTTLLKGNISTNRISSKELTKIFREYEETSGKRSAEDKLFRQLKATYLDMILKDVSIENHNNPFVMVIENNVKFALKSIKETNESFKSQISREIAELSKSPAVKKKEQVVVSTTSISPEEIFKKNALKCTEEWLVAVNGEMDRANLRMIAIQYKCYQDVKLFNDVVFKAFMHIQDRINEHYNNEITSVERLCKFLQLSVENGKKIQESLRLEGDKFIIDPNLLQFITPVAVVEPMEIKEIQMEYDFCISQVARLCAQFRIVAPTGLILEQAFIYVLQDFIIFGKEAFKGSFIPNAWKRIDPEDVPKLSQSMFGENVYIDWRDFLIFCLNIRFPTIDELLDLRKAYRCKDLESTELISHMEFLNEKLWFEDECDPDDRLAQLRLYLIKNFLFELFATSPDTFNYTAFLLAFCKALEPEEGFANALSMAIGKKICFNLSECGDVVNNLIELKRYKDACLICAHKCTDRFLDTLIHKVIDYCEGTTLIDLGPGEHKDSSRKTGRKTLKDKLTKKAESARGPARSSKPSVKTKKSQSSIDVKSTFLCKACEQLPVDPEETKEKIEENEEEEKEEEVLQPDPNLAYTVSQDVLWNILQICTPWYFGKDWDSRYKMKTAETIRQLALLTDTGDIYVCKFISDRNFCKFLHKVKKFTIFNLINEISQLINK